MGLTSAAAVKARAAQTPVDYVIFDLLHLDGHCLRDLPYVRRRELLDELGLEGPLADPSLPPRRRRHSARGDAPTGSRGHRREALRQPLPAREDAAGEWIKERVWRRQEFVIGGYIPGEGRRANRVGSLLVGYYDRRASRAPQGEPQTLHFAGGVGSGLTEDLIDRLTRELRARAAPDSPFEVGAPTGPKARYAVWCEPELVCQVSWTEWTDEGTLRQPAFKGMRDDKDPREVVREP